MGTLLGTSVHEDPLMLYAWSVEYDEPTNSFNQQKDGGKLRPKLQDKYIWKIFFNPNIIVSPFWWEWTDAVWKFKDECEVEFHTTFSGKEVVVNLPISEIARSSSGGGFSLKTSRPLLASSASSGSLRLGHPKKMLGSLWHWGRGAYFSYFHKVWRLLVCNESRRQT